MNLYNSIINIKTMSKNIEKLNSLINNLPPVPKLVDLATVGSFDNITNYKTIEDIGTCFGIGLLYKKEIAVQEMFLSKDTKFPFHAHDPEVEFGIVYKGLLEVNIDGEKTKVGVGDCIKFNPTEIHASKALEDTWLIAISIPKVDGYPNAK